MQNQSIKIRKQSQQDIAKVHQLIRQSFYNLYQLGADEHYLAHIIRKSKDFIPELSLIAQIINSKGNMNENNEIVGHIMYSHSNVIYQDHGKGLGQVSEVSAIKTITFGPVCVKPGYQGKGIGQKLIKESLKIAKDIGYKAIVILGSPLYYCKFGFKMSKQFNIKAQDGKYYCGMQVLELAQNYLPKDIQGIFKQSSSFRDINNEDLINFDAKFPQKQKFKTKSQQIFKILSKLEWHERDQLKNINIKDSYDTRKIQ